MAKSQRLFVGLAGFVLAAVSVCTLVAAVEDGLLGGRNWRLIAMLSRDHLGWDSDFGDRFENGTLAEVQQKGRGSNFSFLGFSIITTYRAHRTVFIWIPHWPIALAALFGTGWGLYLASRAMALTDIRGFPVIQRKPN